MKAAQGAAFALLARLDGALGAEPVQGGPEHSRHGAGAPIARVGEDELGQVLVRDPLTERAQGLQDQPFTAACRGPLWSKRVAEGWTRLREAAAGSLPAIGAAAGPVARVTTGIALTRTTSP